MRPFSREPLKEFINKSQYEKPPQHKKKEDSIEDIVFSLILSVFLIGTILFAGQTPTALVSFDTNTDVLTINTLYNESTNLTFVLEGIPTSLRITGSFIGNGSGLIFLDPFIAVDKDQLPTSGGLSITGFVVFTNQSNESVIENVTVEINETNLTFNMTVNETIDTNLTVNVTENLTIIPNITLNVSENITEINITEINVTQNITENVTINETLIQNITIEVEIREFEEYCLETCFLNDIPSLINLEIILDNVILNLSHITYTYEVIEEEIIDIPPVFENVTTNITEINVTVNETNITLNLTKINLTNITEINLTNVTIELNLTNITQINVTNITFQPLTEFALFNLSLKNQGLLLLDYTQILGKYDVTLGFDKNNLVKLSIDSLSKVKVNFFNSNDTRLNSKVVSIGNNITSADISLASDNIDVILQCVQFTNDTCKKWVKTSIPYLLQNNLVNFSVNEPGIYSTGTLNPVKKEFIPSNSVYYNSDCEYCEKTANCQAEKVCPMQNVAPHGSTFISQLDFDIFNLDNSWETAEVCAYIYYYKGPVINYLKNSPESYCSNIDYGNSTSTLITYKLITSKNEWVCINASEIIRDTESKEYSNVFINWLGQDLNGGRFPFNCYYGIIDLENCNNYNPSGVNDCRPYLKLTYK